MSSESRIIVNTAIALFHLGFAVAARTQTYSGVKCLGSFCVDHTTSLDGLAERLGGPSRVGGSYGYRTADQRAFLVISGSGELGYMSLEGFPQVERVARERRQAHDREPLAVENVGRNWLEQHGRGSH